MSQRRLLIDNDAFILLAGASLLKQAIAQLGFELDQARRLPALLPMLRKPARAFQKYPREVLSRALEECDLVAEIDEAPSVTTRELFASGIQGVDDGEAVLLGLTAEHSFYYLASNDKTAMRAVAKEARLMGIRKAVAGRVICMESVTLKLIQTQGPEAVAQRFGAVGASDKRLASILSPASSGRPQDCLVAAESFIASLRRELGNDFLFEP